MDCKYVYGNNCHINVGVGNQILDSIDDFWMAKFRPHSQRSHTSYALRYSEIRAYVSPRKNGGNSREIDKTIHLVKDTELRFTMLITKHFLCRWTETLISISLSLLMWMLDIYPPFVKILQTGEAFENLPKIGLIVDLSFWTLAMFCQASTRIFTKFKHPLMENEKSNEIFSNASLIFCFVARTISPILTALRFHENFGQTSYICGKILIIPFQILYCHSKAKLFFFNNHPKLLTFCQTLKKVIPLPNRRIHPQDDVV